MENRKVQGAAQPNQTPGFEGVVGQSVMLQAVLRQVDLVARTDASVLICGETGTGKELIAKAIHARSTRHHQALVKLNCAAVPHGLLESELFGHEKGAFTGAIARRTGRFELADQATLFLDEVGEMPLELQPKLLRVLQEGEFERLGSCRVLRSDVRLVAATHRDLEQMVDEGAFRADLYYRLNVFPIRVPALRDRPEDIPLLAQTFAERYAQQMGKSPSALSPSAMAALKQHAWPGNVRELQNVVERAVILGSGPRLEVCLPEQGRPCSSVSWTQGDALDGVTRAHIVSVLQRTNGVVGGPNGAAARLGLKRSTLNFRMKKLGIPFGAGARTYDGAAPQGARARAS